MPTEQDALDAQQLAAERRAKAEALHGLSEEVPKVTADIAVRIATAIAEQGSAAYNTPSDAVLELLPQLADEDDLVSFSRAFVIVARAKPANAAFVSAAVPGKITNFLFKHRGIDFSAFQSCTKENYSWSNDPKNAVRKPERFPQVVEAIADAIKASRAN